jgi:hypothetical protein
MFFAASVAAANAIADSYACKQAAATRICMTAALQSGCVGVFYHAIAAVQGGTSRFYDWMVVSGYLPPGVSLAGSSPGLTSVRIEGTPTQSGVFTFTLRATDQRGSFTQRNFSITIFAITSGNPPDAEFGVPYSFQFEADGPDPIIWFVSSGQLPAGLTLSPDGLLSGTPTTTGGESVNFTVCLEEDEP